LAPTPSARFDDRNEAATAVDYVLVVWRRRWMVLGLVGLALLATLLVSMISPRVYESTASVIAPKEGGGQILGVLGGGGLLQQLASTLPSMTPNRDLLLSVLKSRTMLQSVVDRFQLQDRYRSRHLEDAVNRLRNATALTVSREGAIFVKVEDNNPAAAAEIANFYILQLDRLVTRYGIGEAGRQRRFLTEQLAQAKVGLDAAEEALRGFQERNRAIVLQDQTKGAIEAAARLKGEIVAAEVQLQVMRSFATDANPDILSLKRRIDEMNRQLGQMQYGDGKSRRADAGSADRRDFSVPFVRVPELGLELVRLTRDVRVQETVLTLLTQQLEQARINEARDLPVVQVLDQAVPAERASKPRTGLNLVVAGVTSLLTGIILAFGVEYLKNSSRRPRVA
jgi:capsule polysaccharide export protein KpsE/RkpR